MFGVFQFVKFLLVEFHFGWHVGRSVVKDIHAVVKEDDTIDERVEKFVFLLVVLVFLPCKVSQERLYRFIFERLNLSCLFQCDLFFENVILLFQSKQSFFCRLRNNSLGDSVQKAVYRLLHLLLLLFEQSERVGLCNGYC